MPISKGEPWGARAPLPSSVVRCSDDAHVARVVWTKHHEVEPVVVQVAAGDLLRTVGGTESPTPPGGDQRAAGVASGDETALLLPIDLCVVRCDDSEPLPFVAHLSAHQRWWHGEGAVAMNAAWMGPWYLGPRAHPNDGLIDTTVGRLPARQRIEARRRAVLGTHLPHPALTTSRNRSWSHEFARPTPVFLDGKPGPRARRLVVEVVPDAFVLAL